MASIRWGGGGTKNDMREEDIVKHDASDKTLICEGLRGSGTADFDEPAVFAMHHEPCASILVWIWVGACALKCADSPT